MNNQTKKIIALSVTLIALVSSLFIALKEDKEPNSSDYQSAEDVLGSLFSPNDTDESEQSFATYAKWINVDYASFKEHFGTPDDMIWYDGPLYQCGDEYYGFSEMPYSDSDELVEPSPFAVCTVIYTDVNGWLNLDDGSAEIKSIDDVRDRVDFSIAKTYHDMDGVYYFSGENSVYSVTIFEGEDEEVSGKSGVVLSSIWPEVPDNVTYKSSVDEDTLEEKNGIQYTPDGRILYKADTNLDGSVTLPYGVERIYAGAFKDCDKITEIKLPRTVRFIENNAFENCKKLNYINIPTGVIDIGADTFKECDSLEFVKIPQSVRKMIRGFSGCDNLKTVVWLARDMEPYSNPLDRCPVENLLVGGSATAIPLDLVGTTNSYDSVTNLYLCGTTTVSGTNYGSALRWPANIYYTGDSATFNKLYSNYKTRQLDLWKFDQINYDFNEYDFPYLDMCTER